MKAYLTAEADTTETILPKERGNKMTPKDIQLWPLMPLSYLKEVSSEVDRN